MQDYDLSMLLKEISEKEDQLEKDAKATYSLYTQNLKYLQCLSNAMIKAQEFIEKNFPGVDTTIYGRIKSENSFMDKKYMKKGNVFDIFAFKIVVNKVPGNHSNTSVDDEDKLNIEMGHKIATALVSKNSAFLSELEALNVAEREKEYNKPNGYVASQRTIEMLPDPSINIPCFVEFQCRSIYRDAIARGNHNKYKQDMYSLSNYGIFPKEDFDKCETEEDFEKLCSSVHRYIVLRNHKTFELSGEANFLQAHLNYFFEKAKDENGELYYVHQEDVDKLFKFYKKQKSKPFPSDVEKNYVER